MPHCDRFLFTARACAQHGSAVPGIRMHDFILVSEVLSGMSKDALFSVRKWMSICGNKVMVKKHTGSKSSQTG